MDYDHTGIRRRTVRQRQIRAVEGFGSHRFSLARCVVRARSNRRPSAFQDYGSPCRTGHGGLFRAQRAAVHAGGPWCTWMNETRNETEPSLLT